MILVERTTLDGVLLLTAQVHGDERGFMVETVRDTDLEAAGILDQFVQESQSRSVRGTLRGLHFQAPPGQAKLVRVARGSILDVVVDIRRGSAGFGHHVAIALDDITHRQLYVPPGFAHGFCVTSDVADVVYRLSRYYDSNLERGIAWNDPALGIAWPMKDPTLSDRDRSHSPLDSLPRDLTTWDEPLG